MSMFSAVDAAADPARAIAYLDHTRRAQSGMKQYAAAAHALEAPDGFVLDVGCGLGHDLALLRGVGVSSIGVDASAALLAEAKQRHGRAFPLLRAAGEALPFPDASIAGARMERVLQHAVDPAALLREVVRCLRPGALLTVFEPNWAGFTVRTDAGDAACGWISAVRHPGVGAALWELLEGAGCLVLDRVEELSVWRSLGVLDGAIGLDRSVAAAVATGRVSAEVAEHWLREQRARDAAGTFLATMPKVMVVARRATPSQSG